MVYTWQIAPGSFVSVNWKDAIFTFTNEIDRRYGENISSTIKNDHYNTLSVKLIYYIDISYFKNLRK